MNPIFYTLLLLFLCSLPMLAQQESDENTNVLDLELLDLLLAEPDSLTSTPTDSSAASETIFELLTAEPEPVATNDAVTSTEADIGSDTFDLLELLLAEPDSVVAETGTIETKK